MRIGALGDSFDVDADPWRKAYAAVERQVAAARRAAPSPGLLLRVMGRGGRGNKPVPSGRPAPDQVPGKRAKRRHGRRG